MVFKNLITSKKFIVTLATMLVIALNDMFALGLSDASLIQIAGLAAAYVLGQGVADWGKSVELLQEDTKKPTDDK